MVKEFSPSEYFDAQSRKEKVDKEQEQGRKEARVCRVYLNKLKSAELLNEFFPGGNGRLCDTFSPNGFEFGQKITSIEEQIIAKRDELNLGDLSPEAIKEVLGGVQFGVDVLYMNRDEFIAHVNSVEKSLIK